MMTREAKREYAGFSTSPSANASSASSGSQPSGVSKIADGGNGKARGLRQPDKRALMMQPVELVQRRC
ncbi:hypothetical protein OMP38_27275 [Cohnella ginsengisoli]|uniref:Uncharacterized protein n=1 Tax=Cohnella ginsengisoli TaxID=425004 RepID=A0A9X4QPP3_9BACL|nr:hypothetical protein [Cohnella ginsengisoli]MDG0794118.1 hypothetical protein [Cohnella ginsengisoli]